MERDDLWDISFKIMKKMARRMLGHDSTQCLYQLQAKLESETSAEQCFEAALKWLRNKFPGSGFPDNLRQLEAFELSRAGHKLRTKSSSGEFAFSYTHPDRYSTTGFWWVEFTYNRSAMGVRLLFRDYAPGARKAPASRINLVLDLASTLTLLDLWPIDVEPYVVDSRELVKDFFDLVTANDRFLPIVLVTQNRVDGHAPLSWPVDIHSLAEKLAGIAHVVTMTQSATVHWTGSVGKEWSAFHGAIRVYMPGLNFDTDGLVNHPLTLGSIVESTGESFVENLRSRLLEFSGNRNVKWGSLNFYEHWSEAAEPEQVVPKTMSGNVGTVSQAEHVTQANLGAEPGELSKSVAFLQTAPSNSVCVMASLTSNIRRWSPEADEIWGLFLHLGLLACPMGVTDSILGLKGYAETFQAHCDLTLLPSSVQWLEFKDLWAGFLSESFRVARSSADRLHIVALQDCQLGFPELWMRPLLNVASGLTTALLPGDEASVWPPNFRLVLEFRSHQSDYRIPVELVKASPRLEMPRNQLEVADFPATAFLRDSLSDFFTTCLAGINQASREPVDELVDIPLKVLAPFHLNAAKDVAKIASLSTALGLTPDRALALARLVRFDRILALEQDSNDSGVNSQTICSP